MTSLVFAVYDVKSELYSTPFFALRDGMALRMFMDVVNGGETSVSKHPGDFKLVRLGTFDDSSGIISGHEPVTLGWGVDVLERS